MISRRFQQSNNTNVISSPSFNNNNLHQQQQIMPSPSSATAVVQNKNNERTTSPFHQFVATVEERTKLHRGNSIRKDQKTSNDVDENNKNKQLRGLKSLEIILDLLEEDNQVKKMGENRV